MKNGAANPAEGLRAPLLIAEPGPHDQQVAALLGKGGFYGVFGRIAKPGGSEGIVASGSSSPREAQSYKVR
jgi:hypothetical protein